MCWSFLRSLGAIGNFVREVAGARRLLSLDCHCRRGLWRTQRELGGQPLFLFHSRLQPHCSMSCSSHIPFSQTSLNVHLEGTSHTSSLRKYYLRCLKCYHFWQHSKEESPSLLWPTVICTGLHVGSFHFIRFCEWLLCSYPWINCELFESRLWLSHLCSSYNFRLSLCI